MGQLIKLTVFKRNDTLKSGSEMIFDTDSIISPIRLNGAGKSYFTVKSKSSTHRDGDLVDYQVNEVLADIKALSGNLVLLTVNTRHGNAISESFLFNIHKMNEISTVTAGSSFLNVENGDPLPVEYIVDEDLDNIISQANNLILLTDSGQFNTPDTDDAISVNIGGVTKYIQLLNYTP